MPPPIVGTLSAQSETVTGSLSTTDAANPARTGRWSDDYQLLDVTAGDLVTLELNASDFDPYLQLIDADTQQVILQDDDSGTGTNARLNFLAESGTNYLVRITSDRSNATGAYELTASSAPAIALPANLNDAGGYLWDIQQDGNIFNGTSDAYDRGLDLNGFPSFVAARTEEDGHELVIGAASIGSVEVIRKIYIPQDQSWARFLEIITNPGETSVDYTVDLNTNLGSDSSTVVVGTSSGDTTFTREDHWLVTDDSSDGGGDPTMLHLVSSLGGVAPTRVQQNGDFIGADYTLTLAPGETQIIMHFAAQNSDRATALAKAAELSDLELDALAGMSAEERVRVVNFAIADFVDDKANLQVTTASSSKTTLSPGESFNLDWTVSNLGVDSTTTDWIDAVYLSTDTNWEPEADRLLVEAAGSPLNAEESYPRSFNITFPDEGVEPGEYYFLFVADTNNSLPETNENDNLRPVAVEVVVPDLQISVTDAPATAYLDEEISVAWTVTNTGAGTAFGEWYDAIYLSTDEVYDPGDISLASRDAFSYTPLADQASYNQSQSFTLTASEPGDYYLLFVTDANAQQPEVLESNNLAPVAITVEPPPHADLVVEAVTAPSESLSGEPIEVQWRSRNQGTATTDATAWIDRLVLSTDTSVDPEDVELARIKQTAALAVNQDTTPTATVTLPNGIAGDYYILVTTDYNNAVFEYVYEDNNTNQSQAPIAVTRKPDPDLQVTEIGFPTSAQPGQSLRIGWTVENADVGRAEGSWEDRVYLSADGTLESAIFLGAVVQDTALASGATYPASIDVVLPDIEDGDYQVIVVTDARDQVYEGAGEDNNLKATAEALTISHPDLVPTLNKTPTTVESGTTLDLTWSVLNQGSGPAVGDWIDRLYLSQNENLDASDRVLAASSRSQPLPPEQSYPASAAFEIPIELAGEFYLLLVTDATQAVEEVADEGNNITATPLSISLAPYADLEVSGVTVTVPEQPLIADPASIEVSWTVTNQGEGTSNVSQWVDRAIASVDNEIGNRDDIVLAEFPRTAALDPEAAYPRTERFLLPPAFAGRYRIFIQTDALNEVFENGNTANNAVAAPNPIEVSPDVYADLVVDAVTAEQNPDNRRTLLVSWTVSNQGIGLTNTERWYDSVVLATDPAGENQIAELVALNTQQERIEHVGRLAVGKSYERTVEMELPDGIEGTYYVVVNTAVSGGPYEFLYRDNNTKVSEAVGIEFAPAPDLHVTDIIAPSEVESGQRIDVSWTVENQGTGDAVEGWVDRVYLQSPGDPEAEPIFLGTWDFRDGLQSGKFYIRSEQLLVPKTVQGLYQVVVETNTTGSLYEAGARENNVTADTETLAIALPDRPDLQVRSIAVPDQVTAGATASIDFTIINNGSAATTTPRWTDEVYLSLDNQFSRRNDQLVASLGNASALAVGESYTTPNVLFEVPRYYRGDVYLFVVTDAEEDVDENAQDENNITSIPLNVEMLDPADLVTSDVVAADQAFAGSTITVSYKVTNKGIGETDREGWTDTIWLTRDRDRPSPVAQGSPPKPNDILLATLEHEGSLAVGESYEEPEVRVTIPAGTAAGEWHITPWTDTYAIVTEDTQDVNINPDDPDEFDNNNYKARPITVLKTDLAPDLTVTEVVPQPEGVAGESFNVRWTVANQGNADAQGDWIDTVWLSDRPTLDDPEANTWFLAEVPHTDGLSIDQTYTASLDVDLSPATVGKYVIVETSPGADPDEGPDGKLNNTNFGETQVTKTLADLVVTALEVPETSDSGEVVTIEWTVENQGDAMWSGTRFWADSIYLSPDPDLILERATPLGSLLFAPETPLAPGDRYTQVQDVALPTGIEGDYFIHLQINNNPAVDTRQEVLPTKGENEEIYRAFTSRGYEEFANNLESAPLPVIYREPDLQVTEFSLPDTAQSGTEIPITWTVENLGTRATRTGTWWDRIYLSRDRSLDFEDIIVGDFRKPGRRTVLGQDKSYNRTETIRLPDGIAGDFHLILVTDAILVDVDDRRVESPPGDFPPEYASIYYEDDVNRTLVQVGEYRDEGNNTVVQSLPIELSPAPDLQVTNIEIPQRAIAGQSFDLTYTVTNRGDGDTPPTESEWQDLIYLSRDEYLDLESDYYTISYNTRYNKGSSSLSVAFS